jgi:hypothetical protein
MLGQPTAGVGVGHICFPAGTPSYRSPAGFSLLLFPILHSEPNGYFWLLSATRTLANSNTTSEKHHSHPFFLSSAFTLPILEPVAVGPEDGFISPFASACYVVATLLATPRRLLKSAQCSRLPQSFQNDTIVLPIPLILENLRRGHKERTRK